MLNKPRRRNVKSEVKDRRIKDDGQASRKFVAAFQVIIFKRIADNQLIQACKQTHQTRAAKVNWIFIFCEQQ